jgi:hypothetical protein
MELVNFLEKKSRVIFGSLRINIKETIMNEF